MRYVKIIGVFTIIYLVYFGFSKFMDSSQKVAEKVNKISEIDKIEASNSKEVVGLMMFLGNPPKINEQFLIIRRLSN